MTPKQQAAIKAANMSGWHADTDEAFPDKAYILNNILLRVDGFMRGVDWADARYARLREWAQRQIADAARMDDQRWDDSSYGKTAEDYTAERLAEFDKQEAEHDA